MEKSADAFRTISEVSDELDLPQHVLRFWETRFQQIRPLKRAGGRRYYRPTDIVLLRAIRQLLYDEGYTIKGVQRLLKEQGARALVEPRFGDTAESHEGEAAHRCIEARIEPSLSPRQEVSEAKPPPRSVENMSETMIGDQAALEASNVEKIHEALGLVESCLAILDAVRCLRA